MLLLLLNPLLLLNGSTKSLCDAEEALEIIDVKTVGVQVSKGSGVCELGGASERQESLGDCV